MRILIVEEGKQVTRRRVAMWMDQNGPAVGIDSQPCESCGSADSKEDRQATLELEDETGSLLVLVLESCNPDAVEALPKDGDRVRVTEMVQVLKSEAPRNVRVQATQIQILESH